jgi:hypothetical protein
MLEGQNVLLIHLLSEAEQKRRFPFSGESNRFNFFQTNKQTNKQPKTVLSSEVLNIVDQSQPKKSYCSLFSTYKMSYES